MLERFFHLKEHKTSVKTEIMAGVTTFMTMAYILAVNPNLLSASGMDKTAVFIATCLASALGSILMAILANYPIALAPGMGLNAYFAFTVCGSMGISWKVALMAIFLEGIIFVLLTLTNIREAIFNSIPTSLKHGVSAGIGLFIAFIGLQGANIVVANSSTLITYQHFREDFHSVGIGAILALIGIVITGVLMAKNVKGAILLGILATWILGIVCEITGIYIPNADAGMYSVIPSWYWTDFTSIGATFGELFKANFTGVSIVNFIIVVFAFLFVDLFDTLGALIGVATKANLLDEKGRLPKIKGALLADSIATTAGAIFGTSTTTTYVESTTGVVAGGRTGLTAVTTGLLFVVAIVFAPIFLTIPSFATAPALVMVGFFMMSSILEIDFNDITEAIPAYLAIIGMPFTYSISEGIAIGFISYTIINLACGKAKEKKISVLMYVLTILFICKYIFAST